MSSPFLPPDYRTATKQENSNASEDKFWNAKKLGDGESATFRPCGTHSSGHVIAGFKYFTVDSKPKSTAKYPDNYLDDVGLAYDYHKLSPDAKVAKYQEVKAMPGAEQKEHLGRPSYFLQFTALSKETKEFVALEISQKGIREYFEEYLSQDDFLFLDSGIANFTITIKKKIEGGKTNYLLTARLAKPPAAVEKEWLAVKDGIWMPAIFEGGDPFAGKPAQAKVTGLPPTARDELGADKELEDSMPEEGW